MDKEKIEIKYSNDIFFKYLLYDVEDRDSYDLLQMFIEEILNIKCHTLIVLNPELNPNHIKDKKMILDVLVKVNDDFIVDLEMQTSSLTTSIRQRFQIYGSRMLLTQIPKGEDYGHVKPVYQIIFINDYNKEEPNVLMSNYAYRTQRGQKEKDNLSTRVYVYLPVINQIAKIKNELNELETAVYIFKNGLQCVKIKLNQKVVDIMEKKNEAFTKEEELAWLAFEEECGKWEYAMGIKDSFDDGLKEGKTLGVEEGQKEMSYQLLQAKYGKQDNEWVDTLTQEQIKVLITLILTVNDYETLKKQVLLA